MSHFLNFIFLTLIAAGALTVSPSLSDPAGLKMPIMVAGMAGLVLVHLGRISFSSTLILFLFYWLCAYLGISQIGLHQETAVALAGMLLAYLLGYLRVTLTHRYFIIPLLLVCLSRGLYQLITLSRFGGEGIADAQTGIVAPNYDMISFFNDKHIFGGVLILGAFFHFYLMEKGGPHKPVQVLLYSTDLLILLSILLVDSRIAQGVFFLCFLPLLFISVRLDGREPGLERLAWTTGITLCVGMAWINLPDRQLHKVAMAFSSSSPGYLRWAWTAAWNTFRSAPWMGSGTGSFPFAVIDHQGIWSSSDAGGVSPILAHAHNHFLETLVEGGLLGFGLETVLLCGSLFALSREYFRESRMEPKYAFFSLAALGMLGFFSTVLEDAPLRLVYWMLIGYGWSFLGAHRPGPAYAKILLAIIVMIPTVFHLCMLVPELRSDLWYVRALPFKQSNPKAYTDLLVESLRINPRNESANYRYAEVLADFNREKEAVSQLSFIQSFAPDPNRHAFVLAKIYFTMQRYDSSARYAALDLQNHPYHLPALEILMGSFEKRNRCDEVDSLHQTMATPTESYSMPPAQDYTIESLDSLFRSNSEVLFLQRWFGGQALRKRFVESHLAFYNQRVLEYERLRALMDKPCAKPKSDSLPVPRMRRWKLKWLG